MSLRPRPFVLPCCLLSIVHLCETLHPDPGLTAYTCRKCSAAAFVAISGSSRHGSLEQTSRGVGTVGQRVPLWGDRDAGLRSTARSSMSGEYLRQGYRTGQRGSFWSVLAVLELHDSSKR
ncbi:hypothetical protein V8C44DRAFT_154170 [Trichoderma aethiopicum]